MRYTEILALTMGNLAAAQFSTTRFANTTTSAIETGTATTGTETTGTETSAASTSTQAGGIGNPDGFNFLGCFSGNGFASFSLAFSSDNNDADTCAESCLGSNFFGLYDTSCYCGSELDLSVSISVSTSQCDITCPGDDSVSCGGLNSGSRMMRRQNVDINVLLSIYVAAGVNPGETDTVVNTDFVTETLPPVTTTATVTFTESGEVSTKTVTTVVAAIPTDVIIVCYGNYCAPQTHCPSCSKWQVVCEDGFCAPRECHDDTWNQLKICNNGLCHYADYKEEECNQRIVCYGSSCEYETSNDYARKFVCDVDEERYYFEECHDDCYTYEKCSNGECAPVHPPVSPPKTVSPPKPMTPGQPPVVVIPEPKPETPSKPGMPAKPETPSKPGMPAKPETPSKPEQPEMPSKPEQPNSPAKPQQPETPAQPQQPNSPAKPETPENPAKPEVPVVTAGAAKSFVSLAAAVAGFAFFL